MKIFAKRTRFVPAAVIIVLGSLSALLASRSQSVPSGLALLGDPTISGTRFTVMITNVSGRSVFYEVSRLQFERDGVWSEGGLIGCSGVPSSQSFTPTPLPKFVMLQPQTLSSGQTATVTGSRPFHITSPSGATVWRVPVVWGYSSPTRWEQWKSKAVMLLTGCAPTFRSGVFTNFSTTVPL